MLEMIKLEQAQKTVLSLVYPTLKQEVSLEASLGRVLAEPVVAELDIPPFDRSPLDGYALHGEDTQGELPVDLKLTGEIPAGDYFNDLVERGSAVRILTGSPLPPGANSVIRQEDTEEVSGFVRIHKPVKPGANISRQGEDIKRGEQFNPGGEITPALIGVLASQGLERVKVYAKPKVALASTGDELVELGSRLAPGKIYNTNLYSLGAMVQSWGGETVCLGLVKDRVEDLARVIAQGLEKADLVVTTGGASVGTYDVTLEAMKQAGAEILFWRVAMKPGTPVICGRKGSKLILGLSGNPAAAMISAALLLGPMVRKLSGYNNYFPKRISAISRNSFNKTSGVRRMIRANTGLEPAGFTASFPEQQQPGVLKSMLYTNALVDLPPGAVLENGQMCEVILLDQWEGLK